MSLTKRQKRERLLRKTVREVGIELVTMQRRLLDAGLVRTMHAVNKASKQLGWEAVDLLETEL